MDKPSFTLLAPEIYDEENIQILQQLQSLCEQFPQLDITKKIEADVLKVLGDTKEAMVTKGYTRNFNEEKNPMNSFNILYTVIANARDKFFFITTLNAFHQSLHDAGGGGNKA